MELHINDWKDGSTIPAKFTFGKPGIDEPFAPSDNISPAVSWTDLPEGTQSLALIVHDSDVPTKPDDVNQPDRQVPADLPRADFYHWVLVNIPATLTELTEGAGGTPGITPKGKSIENTPYGLTGENNYTQWFAGDPDMEGVYGGYDGPCPPWNDSIIHHYHYTLYALSVPSIDLKGAFTGDDALAAIKPHILASAVHAGTYSMNPSVQA